MSKIDSNFWNFKDTTDFKMKRKRIKEKYGLDFSIAEVIEAATQKALELLYRRKQVLTETIVLY